LAKFVPPTAAEYQSIVSPAAGDADTVIIPDEHLFALVPVGAFGKGFIVAINAVLTEEAQPLIV
jgi:hypothetical protein